MRPSVEPLSDAIGVRINGVDLSETLSAENFDFVYQSLVRNKVIAFSDQRLSPEQHILFSKRFGACDVHSNNQSLLDGFPEILVLSNDLKDGKPIGVVDAGVEWHSDLSWQIDPPLGSILHCLKTPASGGNTGFINMAAVYQELSDDLKKIVQGLEGIHCVSKLVNPRVTISENRVNAREFYAKQLEKHPPVQHPLVYEHPETKEMILFASPRFTIGIAEIPDDEGQSILDELFVHLERTSAKLEYVWAEGDVVMWDNRSVLHCAMGGYSYPDIRLINRTTVLCSDETRLQRASCALA
ncbi:MAG: taurine catabolism dioxygenase TauD [Gammaproteobacteria bacterium]|nr:taurine catabolism dioxygenase TauD [Gammaproteobacteria bacterium]